ncbi:hypothetical protein CNMCM5793_000993 [Aspergillus hiratsukae]|uniref:Aspartate aminotransferase n=1 Tax=Aspergillus hiratsukae TaxID=1194566 RepID=A0A8H6PMR1_9EURO|nr:hypothetical protein CNMCM5793_000993 [Aspergillus hiratsukae]KAF7156993.1 hypothetical protein CNMCM6106_001772 [Aspergillus hiratsukae]
MAAFDADSHPNKVSLITGAYRDEEGQPWVLPSVRQAKDRLAGSDHEYLSITGSPTLIDLAKSLTFGSDITNRLWSNIASLQTVSGTGANHLAAAFLSKHLQPKRVFIPDPSWVNHKTVWATAGPAVTQHEYPYYSPSTQSVDIEAMLSFLDTTAEPNDVLILQACAHNPTGTDLTKWQWIELGKLVKEKELFPVFDSAYQGFATGDVDADAWAIRYFTEQMLTDADSRLPGVCVAQSFSKNFGLYGERVGALHLVVPPGLSAAGAKSRLTLMARAEYSSPVKFGASIVETLLGDPELKAQWERDLITMSSRIKTMRSRLRGKLQEYVACGDWSFIERQIGMFCYTGMSPDQVSRLQEEYHVYLMPSGRLSICGLTEGNVDYVARAIRDVVGLG